MGYNDLYPEDYVEHIANCKVCGKRFRFITEEQIPGFRAMDALYCPYCNAELARSMEIEFSGVKKIDED